MGRGLKSFEVNVRNMNVKGNSAESLERKKKKKSWSQSFHLLKDYINNYKQNVGKNMGIEKNLVRSQMDMTNMLLESGVKVSLVERWQITWLHFVVVFYRR